MGIYKTGIWKTNNIYEKTLPDGYTELEYIESTGTQYIDTGFKPNQDTRIISDFYMNTYSSWYRVPFGTRAANTLQFFIGSAREGGRDDWYYRYNSIVWDPIEAGNPGVAGFHHADLNKNIFTLDNYSYTFTPATFQTDYNCYIFGVNYSGGFDTATSSAMKLYSFKIYDNGTLIRNYIPAKRAVDSIIGLYDTVNNEFYENAGTGTFIAGSAISGASDKAKIYENKLEANSFIEI